LSFSKLTATGGAEAGSSSKSFPQTLMKCFTLEKYKTFHPHTTHTKLRERKKLLQSKIYIHLNFGQSFPCQWRCWMMMTEWQATTFISPILADLERLFISNFIHWNLPNAGAFSLKTFRSISPRTT